MKIRYTILLALFVLATACEKDDEITSSVVGKWSGTKAELRFKLIPYNDDDFNAIIEFKNDGTVNYIDGSQTYSGTYTLNNRNLSITGITVADFPVDISGSYDITTLTSNDLVIEGEREGTVSDPTYGTFSGTVKATFYFNRIAQ
jgi:hypothetical protein